MLEEAGESLLNAWGNIAEGKMRMADDMSRDLEYRSLLKPYAATYDKAAGLLQQGKRGKSRTARLEALIAAIDAADEYMQKAQ